MPSASPATEEFRRILITALSAGFAAGAAVFLLQLFAVVPLIEAAEAFETHAAHAAGDAHNWEPEGLERPIYTLMADIVTAVAYGLLLAAGYAVRGKPIGARAGLLWGLAGFAVFALAPALGLPPELPGAEAADVTARKIWWIMTVAATAGGLGLIAFAENRILKAAGVIFLVVPHLIGAPMAEGHGTVPPEMARQFIVASLATALLFWLVLGGVSGYLFRPKHHS